MEKLNKKEYKILINLVEAKRESMRKESYSNVKVRDEFDDLAMILIKLNRQSKLKTNKEDL